MSAGDRRFAVTCKFCGRIVFTVAELADPEIAILVAHLARWPSAFASKPRSDGCCNASASRRSLGRRLTKGEQGRRRGLCL